MKTALKSSILTGVLALACLAAPALTQPKAGQARPWEHESSDIPVNPRIHFGHLENGLRFAWIKNPEPDQRCYIRLHVNVGSLAEEESEQGMAHFLEHMAFNGSKNFPAGTLIEWFQKHGMSFGADTNATTNFGETTYMIDLPTSDETSILEGLTVLRDYADGLLISEEEVEAEKGVIDGEMRERDSAQYRVMIKGLESLYDGTRYASRLPIGTKGARDKFTADSIRKFYKQWYRPENMTLIVAGDLEALNPEQLIEKKFADLSVPAEKLCAEPAVGTPSMKQLNFFIHEKEIPIVRVNIRKLRPWEDKPANKETWLEDLPLTYAQTMLNLRLSEKAKEEGAPFIGSALTSVTQFNVFDGIGLLVVSKPETWEEGLSSCEQELRKAVKFGFQQEELDEIRADALRSLDEAVVRESTRSTISYVGSILYAAENRSVPANAETRRSIYKPAVEKLTIEACHKALAESWSKGKIAIEGSGFADLGEKGGEVLLAAFEKSQKTEVSPPKKIESQGFAYASDPSKKGKIQSRDHVEDLDFHTLAFENGVYLNVKKTDFKQEQVLMTCRFGEGMLTSDTPQVITAVGNDVFNLGGLGAHSEDELRRLTAGKLVGVNFSVGEDVFVLGGGTSPSDFLLQCELTCAYIKDPGLREEGLRQVQKVLPQIFQSLDHQHQGPLIRNFFPDLYSRHPRFVFPAIEKLMAITLGDVKEWVTPHLLDSPMEVTIIGDIDVASVIESCAATFGMLPKRGKPERFEKRRVAPPLKKGFHSTYEIDTQVPKTLVFMLFPTTDGIDVKRRRNLQFLSSVVNDRLRLHVREKLGAAYSPGAQNSASTVYPGNGYIGIQAMSDPDKVETLQVACLEVAKDLSENGVTQEEVDRLIEPELASIRDAQRVNGYWLNVLNEAQSRPESLTELRSFEEHYRNMKAKPLTELAKKYLTEASASILVVSPKGTKN